MAASAFFEPLRPQHSIRVALEDMLLRTDDGGDNGQTPRAGLSLDYVKMVLSALNAGALALSCCSNVLQV